MMNIAGPLFCITSAKTRRGEIKEFRFFYLRRFMICFYRQSPKLKTCVQEPMAYPKSIVH